jgi:hypothetical protein
MTITYKNIHTGNFAEFGGTPDNSWVKANKKESQNFKIEGLRLKKICEIKAICDQKNVEPIIDCKAFVIGKTGKRTKKSSYFLFYTNRHPSNPSSDPDSIISRVMNLGSMPYFTKDRKGNKITVELTSEIVKILHQKITERNDENFKRSNETEAAIKNAKTVEEIEAIE